MNLKRPVNFKFHTGTIATHSTIANRQHNVFLTFFMFLLSVVVALLAFPPNTCHFGSNQLLIQDNCEKTVLEVLTHAFVLLNNTQG